MLLAKILNFVPNVEINYLKAQCLTAPAHLLILKEPSRTACIYSLVLTIVSLILNPFAKLAVMHAEKVQPAPLLKAPVILGALLNLIFAIIQQVNSVVTGAAINGFYYKVGPRHGDGQLLLISSRYLLLSCRLSRMLPKLGVMTSAL